jgi:hypothetical protein
LAAEHSMGMRRSNVHMQLSHRRNGTHAWDACMHCWRQHVRQPHWSVSCPPGLCVRACVHVRVRRRKRVMHASTLTEAACRAMHRDARMLRMHARGRCRRTCASAAAASSSSSLLSSSLTSMASALSMKSSSMPASRSSVTASASCGVAGSSACSAHTSRTHAGALSPPRAACAPHRPRSSCLCAHGHRHLALSNMRHTAARAGGITRWQGDFQVPAGGLEQQRHACGSEQPPRGAH